MAKNINISLPDEVLERLNKESKALGINRSAYLSMALNQKWQNDEVIKSIPELVRLSENVRAMKESESL